MASGDTLAVFTPFQAEPPATLYGVLTIPSSGTHPALAFNDTTNWSSVFTGIMPRNYSGATGITVLVHWAAASATTGNIGWLAAFERDNDANHNMNAADSFAADQTITDTTVPGTAGVLLTTSVAVAQGANTDSLVAGDQFRLRIKRDATNDSATGDAWLFSVELKET